PPQRSHSVLHGWKINHLVRQKPTHKAVTNITFGLLVFIILCPRYNYPPLRPPQQ
ncbi:hypothetical protein CISIN_1g0383512mg, partial [Citrus sinensis]